MTDAEKVAAFDELAEALTNRWHDGSWTWWPPTACGSAETPRATQAEAVADLIEWAKRTAKKQRSKRCKPNTESTSLPVVQ